MKSPAIKFRLTMFVDKDYLPNINQSLCRLFRQRKTGNRNDSAELSYDVIEIAFPAIDYAL